MGTRAIRTVDYATFRNARRVNQALTARMEKRALNWMAERAPQWVSSDRTDPAGAGRTDREPGICYALTRWDRRALLLAIVCLALNWLGDSLDGTLARVRRQERPRYGFYVDHIVDILGAVALMCGLGASGLLHWATAMAMLDRVSGAFERELSGHLHVVVLPAFARDLWTHGDSHSARARQSGSAAQPLFDGVRA